jgi:hypothetical protein
MTKLSEVGAHKQILQLWAATHQRAVCVFFFSMIACMCASEVLVQQDHQHRLRLMYDIVFGRLNPVQISREAQQQQWVATLNIVQRLKIALSIVPLDADW